jgi:signal transduction histidine kinase
MRELGSSYDVTAISEALDRMPLSQFIRDNLEAILTAWERFATSIPAAKHLSSSGLRDHAGHILLAIAEDMESTQSELQQAAKSKGLKSRGDLKDTAAEAHALARFGDGFDLKEMISEYRALRASVVRLWTESTPHADTDALSELTRFNEGMDQALTESIGRFADRIDDSRELFMGMLGHDLRTPVQTLRQSLTYLQEAGLGADRARDILSMMERCTEDISCMVGDMLDVTRTQFGASLPLTPQPTDAAVVCSSVIDRLESLHPSREIELQRQGDLHGYWDADRLNQLFSNLLKNAIQHGGADSAVRVRAAGEPERVVIEVHNYGEPIPPALLPRIFEPLVTRSAASDNLAGPSGLGLGLYIACVIVKAHHGSIRVQSSRDAGTSFSVFLPRRPPAMLATGA